MQPEILQKYLFSDNPKIIEIGKSLLYNENRSIAIFMNKWESDPQNAMDYIRNSYWYKNEKIENDPNWEAFIYGLEHHVPTYMLSIMYLCFLYWLNRLGFYDK